MTAFTTKRHIMNDEALFTKAFNTMIERWNLKDIRVKFWEDRHYKAGDPYMCRPCVCAVNDKGEQALYRRDKYHVIDYVYVDEFSKDDYIPVIPSGTPRVSIQPFQLACALFRIAQDDPIYYVPSNVDPYYCDLSKYVMLRKRAQVNMFLVESDFSMMTSTAT